jgi:hypothetical protein
MPSRSQIFSEWYGRKPVNRNIVSEEAFNAGWDACNRENESPTHGRFRVTCTMHTKDAVNVLTDPDKVRHMIGQKLDAHGLQEEIDYTLEVTRVHG